MEEQIKQERNQSFKETCAALKRFAIEEEHYPGDKAQADRRKAKIGKVLKREFWPKTKMVQAFYHGDSYIGVRGKRDFYCDGTWIGSIKEITVRHGTYGHRFSHYQTQDGEKFYHYGGPTGAETYLMNKYWRYGDSPSKWTPTSKQLRSVIGMDFWHNVARGWFLCRFWRILYHIFLILYQRLRYCA